LRPNTIPVKLLDFDVVCHATCNTAVDYNFSGEFLENCDALLQAVVLPTLLPYAKAGTVVNAETKLVMMLCSL
jgi:hypothetical protein